MSLIMALHVCAAVLLTAYTLHQAVLLILYWRASRRGVTVQGWWKDPAKRTIPAPCGGGDGAFRGFHQPYSELLRSKHQF
jgi:hypothetical protein